MAGASAPTPSSGRRSLDFQIQLVPMIDLLSVLISFLLMTSVWTQVAKIDVKPGSDQTSGPSAEPDDRALALGVVVKASGYSVTVGGAARAELPLRGEEHDLAALREVLVRVQAERGDQRSVEITTEDRVAYRELIRVMDLCVGLHLDDLRVAGVEG